MNRSQDMKSPASAESPWAEGDLGISYPWNFQHRIHVDESLNGLPPAWTAVVEAGKLGKRSADESKDSGVNDAKTGFFCLGKKPSVTIPETATARAPESREDPVISKPWNIEHNIHVDENFNGLPPTWAVLLSQPTGKTNILTKATRAGSEESEGDAAISTPWNFQHHIHVYAGQDGLPRGLPPAFVARLGDVGYNEVEIAAIHAG